MCVKRALDSENRGALLVNESPSSAFPSCPPTSPRQSAYLIQFVRLPHTAEQGGALDSENRRACSSTGHPGGRAQQQGGKRQRRSRGHRIGRSPGAANLGAGSRAQATESAKGGTGNVTAQHTQRHSKKTQPYLSMRTVMQSASTTCSA